MEFNEISLDLFDEVGVGPPQECKLNNNSANNIYAPLHNGETQLHRAIRSGNKDEINILLDVYQNDFDRVRNWLANRYQCDEEDRIWVKKTILVAIGEEQCESVKRLENKDISKEQLRQAVFVLLQNPVDDGEDVAVLCPNETDRIAVTEQITKLIPNGFLSWNYTDTERNRETYMETAAARGLTEVMVRLFELGAELAIPGHNPLIKACQSNQNETVKWLFNEHFDDFDCTMRNDSGYNALIVTMQKDNRKLFTLVLEKMIAYRVKHCKETESQAFNHIFKFENENVNDCSILTFLIDSPIRKVVETAIVKYELDLSYQWEEVAIISDLIFHKIAVNYWFSYIRANPEVLGIVVRNTTTILHKLIRFEFRDFLKNMYQQNPEVKEYFYVEAGYDTLRMAFSDENRDNLQFLLEHHKEFLKHDMNKLKEIVVCCEYYSKEFYEKRVELFTEFVPELGPDIEEARHNRHSENYYYGKEKTIALYEVKY